MAIDTKDFSPRSKVKAKLTFDEFQQVKEVFINTFDLYFESVIDDGDISELSAYFGKTQSSFNLFSAVLPPAVSSANVVIFTNPVIRSFHLDLLERFSMEIAGIGEDSFQRLINSLAAATIACKAISSKRDDGIEPILTSIHVTHDDVVRVYLENPWLINLTLFNTYFLRTKIGQKFASEV